MNHRIIALAATRLGRGAGGWVGVPRPPPTPPSPPGDPPRRRRPLDRRVADGPSRGLASSSSSPPSSSSSSDHRDGHYDVIIAGGGAVGSALARMLLDDDGGGVGSGRRRHRRRRPLRVALLERRPAPPSLRDLVDGIDGVGGGVGRTTTTTTTTTPDPSPRAYALSPASLSCLGPGVLRALLRRNRCGVYDSMQVWEHDGPAQLHFAGEDLGRAIEDGRLVDLDALVGNYEDENGVEEEEGATTTKEKWENGSANGSGRRRPWLGAVVEDAPLVSSLWDELRNDDRIDLLDDSRITSIRSPSPGDVGNAAGPPPPVRLSYARGGGSDDDGMTTITSDLLVAADGANSQVRSLVGNFPMMSRPYGKKAVTCTVELESGMARTAYQRFLSHGPIALLPVRNVGDAGGDDSIYANVVWSTTTPEADHLLSLSPPEFASALNRHLRLGPGANPPILPDPDHRGAPPPPPFAPPFFSAIAGELDSLLRTANAALTMGTWTESPSRNYFRMPPRCVRVVGPMMGFDLAIAHVAMMTPAGGGPGGTHYYGGGYVSPRVALVGDAAHTMHPMAGQGLNLGMSDVASLSSLIKEAVDSGMDVGGTSLFLDRYNRERMVGGWGVVGGVHGLHEIFGMSGIAPGSVADGTYDGGSGSAGSLRSLIGYGRSLGMNVVNGVPFVRRMLAEVAAGATPFKKKM